VIHLGITGTTIGATLPQAATLWSVMTSFAYDEFHHGDAIGVDALGHTAARAVKEMRGGSLRIVEHPANIPGKRAFCADADVTHEPLPPLARNKHIAASSDVLVAVPFSPEEWLRSGTWATVRYARKYGKIIIRINPDGSVKVG
jgi:hypothetical protein